MKDYNDDDKQFFDKAVLTIMAGYLNREDADEKYIDAAFAWAITMTVKRKTELDNLEESISNAQDEEDDRFKRKVEEYRKEKEAKKAAIMVTPE